MRSSRLCHASSAASSADLAWQRCLGGSSWEYARSVQPTADGGCIVAGYTNSTDGDVSGNHGGDDYWVVKLDCSGNIVWQRCLEGSSWDEAYCVQPTNDGGYIAAGLTYSDDGNVSGNHGESDYWVVKLDGSGNMVWQRCLGGSSWDEAYGARQTADGGYIVAGLTNSTDGNVSGKHEGLDYWIVKLDGTGSIVWQRCLGGSKDDVALSVQTTIGGGYIVSGLTGSDDGDVSGNHGEDDYWVVLLDGDGNLLWQRCLGGSSWEYARSAQPTADGGYVVGGYTYSNDGDVSGNHGELDFWVVLLDGAGNMIWQRCLGGSSWEGAFSIQPTADGGYILVGATDSTDSDVNGLHGDYDYWVVKLGVDARFMSSYEDLLRSQFGLMGSFESLLKNTTLNSSLSYKFLDSFDDLADRQQRGLYSFEDLVSYSWSDVDACQRIKLTDSFEDLLRRQTAIISSNEDLLKRGFCKLGTDDKKQLLDRFEARLKFEVVLLKKFEDWLDYQQMMEETEYDSWIGFLSSFEDLIRRQSNLLDSFEMLMKIDCTEKYINVTKSATPLQLDAGTSVAYTYTVTASSPYTIKNVVVKDSLWGEVGTIDSLSPGAPKTITLTRYPSCADCNNCTCKVCNFATVCGEVITDNGNFTVCDVSNDVCAVVSESAGTSPFYPGGKLAAAAEPTPAVWGAEAPAGTISGDGVPVTIYLDRYPGHGSESAAFDVYVDGKYIGKGRGDSFRFSVSGGYHDIEVDDGRHEYREKIFFQSGVPKILFVYLE